MFFGSLFEPVLKIIGCDSSSLKSVPPVFSFITKLKMIWIKAPPVVTYMKHKKIIWDLTNIKLVGDPTDSACLFFDFD